jgi:C-terminal processing protease CtpA/Prc
MLKEYNFKHHFFMPKEMVQKWKGKNESNEQESTEYNFTYPSGKIISDDIGYVSIPTFLSGDSLQITIFAEKTQQTLKELIQLGAENWIVDLTECQGGDMWPMLSGIGPLIGKGKVGSFFTINDKEEGTWNYENGRAFILSKDSIVHTVKSPFVNKDINPNKIAVLQGEKTASSGEAILVAFLGKKNVRTFGRKTATYSTANESFDLTNGSILWVTTAVYADRDLNKYPDGILPMVEVENDSISLNEAIKWLNEK